MEGYTLLGIKLAMGIIGLVLQINLMGKGNLAPTSAMDQVQNYVLGGIIGGVIYNDAVGILQFLLILIAWTILVMLLKYAKGNSNFIKRLIDGDPQVVINHGKILTDECMRSGLNAHDLHLKLRMADIWHIEEVYKAVLEQNGQLTIMKYDDLDNCYPVIADGLVNDDALELIHKDKAWLREKTAAQGYKIENIYLAEYDKENVILYPYSQSGK